MLRAFAEALSVTFIPQAVYVVWGLVLLIGWAATVVYGVYVTFTARRWGWFVLCLIPVTCVPAAVAYAWIRRQEIERAVLGDEPSPPARQRRGGRESAERPGQARSRLARACARPLCGTVLALAGGSAMSVLWGDAIKKTLRHIIVFAVIVLALYLLLPRLVDTQQTVEYISNASYVLLGVAVALEIAALVGYANLFRYILRVLDIRMRLREVWAITLSGLAVSHILSAGGVGGWVVTYNALMKHQVPHGIIFVAIAAQQFFNYVVLWFFFALAIVYLILVRGSDSIFGYLVGIVLIVLILWLTLYGVYLYNHPTRLRLRATQIAHLVNRVRRREVVKERHIDGWIDNLLIGMRRMVTAPRVVPHHAAARLRRSGSSTCSACGARSGVRLHHRPRPPARRLRGGLLHRDAGAHAGGAGRRRGHHDRALRQLRRAVGGGRRRRARLPHHQLLAADPAGVRRLRDRAARPHARSRRARSRRRPRPR